MIGSFAPINETHVCVAIIAVTGLIKVVAKLGSHKGCLKKNFIGTKAFLIGAFDKSFLLQKMLSKVFGNAKPRRTTIKRVTVFIKSIHVKQALKSQARSVKKMVKAVCLPCFCGEKVVQTYSFNNRNSLREFFGAKMNEFFTVVLFEKLIYFLGAL